MPISFDDLLAAVPAASALKPATVSRKRNIPSKTGGEFDRHRFSADVKAQVERVREVIKDNNARKLAEPAMPAEKPERGKRRYWFQVYKGKILLQLFLGNLALLDKEKLAEAASWQDLISALEALAAASGSGAMDALFAQRRKEAEEARKARNTGTAPAAQPAEGDKPKRSGGRRKAAS